MSGVELAGDVDALRRIEAESGAKAANVEVAAVSLSDVETESALTLIYATMKLFRGTRSPVVRAHRR